MKKRKNAKKTVKKHNNDRKKKMMFIIIVIVVIIAFASVKNIVSLKIEHRRLEKQNEELKEEKVELKKEIKNANSDEYIEKKAREELRLVKPDEILFIFPDGEKPTDVSDQINKNKSENKENKSGEEKKDENK